MTACYICKGWGGPSPPAAPHELREGSDMRFGWLFLLWPMVEIGLFVILGSWIGVWATWGVVFGTAVLGVMLIRWQKRTVMGQVVRDLQTLGGPLTPAAHSAMIVLAGVLLILPGFLTDFAGVVLLIPFVRDAAIGQLRDRVRMTTNVGASAGPRPDDVIDLQAEEVHPASPRLFIRLQAHSMAANGHRMPKRRCIISTTLPHAQPTVISAEELVRQYHPKTASRV